MSIWGKSDPSKLPRDPFRIEPNWYPARAVEIFAKEIDAAEGQWQLTIKWKIRQPGSRFDGLPVGDRNTFWVLDDENMDGEQIQRNAFLHRKLREGFDLTDDQADDFDVKMGLGKDAYIEVTNNPDKNDDKIVYNNVRGVLSPRLFNERYGDGTEENAMAQGGGALIDEI